MARQPRHKSLQETKKKAKPSTYDYVSNPILKAVPPEKKLKAIKKSEPKEVQIRTVKKRGYKIPKTPKVSGLGWGG